MQMYLSLCTRESAEMQLSPGSFEPAGYCLPILVLNLLESINPA